ncbi:hypothetical protein KSP40_PGU005581 [Platanthera guangdongensis]|uniref:H/ACA ribonucleoprotein complex non-core subunit NAF1 n=1 Tax=Platanthera guangdongensis TaxID=2320717 RepID=A0ABR2LVC4_9ASPA
MEETPLLDDNFDPLKECLVDPDPVQLQNPCEFSNISLESHGLHYNGVELESSIDVKMEEVSLLKISDRVHGEVGSNENGGGNDEEINFVTPALEAQKIAPPLPSEVGTCEGQIDNEVERISEVAESDSGDSSSNDSSSDESTSIAESVSSSEDEDDIGMRRSDNVADELEEGEVRELDAHEIDFLSDEEEEGPKGPIKSKHEVEDLPPVPKIDVSLQPHHQMLPVGVILSVMMNKVIVEGSVRHNPLDEGSVLWVTDTRSQLGLVDEIFGPVKNPFYVVRYNNEQEVPAGVEVGISVSFVAEFASQILNDKNLYKKGYDASGDNDEELDNDFDFSDDEKEAEFRRSLRLEKRQGNDRREAKQETRVDRKRDTSMKPRIQHKGIPKQQSCTPSSMNQPQPAAFVGQSGIGHGNSNLSTNTSRVCPQAIRADNFLGNSSQQLNPDLLALSGTRPSPHALQAVNFLSNSSQQLNANLAAPGRPEFLQAMQAVNFIGNSPQQLPALHQSAPWPPGFSPLVQNTGFQGDLPTQLQNQNILLNNLVNLMALQQQLQQFIPHQGSNLPWPGTASSIQPSGQINFTPRPFGNGFIAAPGQPRPGNEQIQDQTPSHFAPYMQFNAGNSSSSGFNGGDSRSHGRRPHFQSGAGGRFVGRGGRQPNL